MSEKSGKTAVEVCASSAMFTERAVPDLRHSQNNLTLLGSDIEIPAHEDALDWRDL